MTWYVYPIVYWSRLKFNECIQGIRFPMYLSKPRIIVIESDEILIPFPCIDTKSYIHVSMHWL